MKSIRFALLSAIGLFILGQASAQNYSISSVGRTSLKNSGEIFDNETIKGYYFFYASEKVSKGMVAYEIVVLNENLEEIATERIKGSKTMSLMESAYNGSAIMFKFYDVKEKKVIYRIMDENGSLEKAGKVTRQATKYEARVYAAQLQQGSENSTIFTPDNNGFIDIHYLKEGNVSYECLYIDNAGDKKWKYTPAPIKKGVLGASFLVANDDQILLVEGEAPSALSRERTLSIKALSKDGKEMFEVPLETDMFNLSPHNAIYNAATKNFMLIGEYYDKSEKMAKAESKGIFIRNINNEGLWVSESTISWESDIYKMLKDEDLSKARKYSIFFHDVVISKDGTILAIGEQYRKQISAKGAAFNALASASDNVTTDAGFAEMKIGDMVLIELTAAGEIKNITFMDKRPNKVTLPKGYELISAHLLGKAMKAMGFYDYAFRQYNDDKSVVTIGYFDLEKEKGKLMKQATFHLASHVDGESELSRNKLSLATEASGIRVYRAKPGYLLIFEHFRKEKKATFRLEPINF